MVKPLWAWATFVCLVLVLLLLDLGFFHRKPRVISVKESLTLSAFYIAVAGFFGLWIAWSMGVPSAIEFYTGFVIEKSLSLDNIFVMSVIFSYFSVPRLYQHRVLFWGIVGVIILRGLMIGMGTAMISRYAWVLYIFGFFLILTGIKMFFEPDRKYDVEKNPLLLFIKRRFPITSTFHGENLWVRKEGVLHATPLFLSLVLVECADIIFAVDSVPAVFAVTLDPYIVFTSNIFAILGLRALYFALSAVLNRFEYIKYSLALVLVFVGGKIFYGELYQKIPALLSLTITITLLMAGVLFSLWRTRQG